MHENTRLLPKRKVHKKLASSWKMRKELYWFPGTRQRASWKKGKEVMVESKIQSGCIFSIFTFQNTKKNLRNAIFVQLFKNFKMLILRI